MRVSDIFILIFNFGRRLGLLFCLTLSFELSLSFLFGFHFLLNLLLSDFGELKLSFFALFALLLSLHFKVRFLVLCCELVLEEFNFLGSRHALIRANALHQLLFNFSDVIFLPQSAWLVRE